MASATKQLARLAVQPSALAAGSVRATQLRTFAASTSARANAASGSSFPDSNRSASPRPARRSSRFSARPGADLVGPPDALSNLRPIKYGSAFDEAPVTGGASGSVSISITHPYSLSEFNPASSSSSSMGLWTSDLGSSRRGGKARGHSLYFERLLERLEEAELAHKLRMARADNFNQRFWQDNNARFIQALQEFRSRTTSSKAVATLKAGTGAESSESAAAQEPELDLDSDTLATFYSAWLKANATRHRAYNRQLWSQTFGDLAPALRYQALRGWAKLVGAAERRLEKG
ncbi:hypothetical protein ACQY0O_001861 [Thecaphora frezii]